MYTYMLQKKKSNYFDDYPFQALNSPISQNVCLHAVAHASYTGVDKITKTLLVLHAKTFEMTKPSIINASDYFKVNRSVMNVNCYYIVYFSVKSFIPHFRSFETCSCVILYCAAFVCRHFPKMQCKFWPILSQLLLAHWIVKQENEYHF